MQSQQQSINKSRLKMKRRLAAEIMKCGKKRIWMNPDRLEEIAFANNRRAIRRLIQDQVIIRKPVAMRTRFKVKRKRAEIKNGRHGGPGRVRGRKNARNNRKENWMRRVRILRRMLHKYRENGKISKKLHRILYLRVKGGQFKTKKVLLEEIFKMKEEEKRNSKIIEEIEVKKRKAVLLRKNKKEREARRIQVRIAKAEQAAELMRSAMKKAQEQKEEEERAEAQK